MPHLQSKYKISFAVAEEPGDEVEFLKRKYRLTEQGLDVVPSAKRIAGLVEQYTMCTGKAPRIYRTPVMGDLFRHDDTEPLPLNLLFTLVMREVMCSLL